MKIFGAMLGALDTMQGVRLPKCGPLTMAGDLVWKDAMDDINLRNTRPNPDAGVCLWGMNEVDRKLPLGERPLSFTSREFWLQFLERYMLPGRHHEEARDISDALNVLWEY